MPCELVDAVLDLRLLVLFEEEARVGEASAHDAIVALRDARRVVRRVHDREVVGEERVAILLHAEVLLMAARDGADDRRRQLEVLRLERARHDVRLLDERCVLVDERGIRVVDAARGLRRRRHALHHRLRALGAIDEDVLGAQRIDVRVGDADLEGARREEAMAARRLARANARERDVDDLVAEERDEPLHRAARTWRCRCPSASTCGTGSRRTARRAPCRASSRASRPVSCRRPTTKRPAFCLPLASFVDDRERVDVDAELVREGLGGLGGLAVLVRGGLGRTHDLLVEIRLRLADAVDEEREASCRAERADLAVRQAERLELRAGEARQGSERGVDERGGELLGSDLEKERLRHG